MLITMIGLSRPIAIAAGCGILLDVQLRDGLQVQRVVAHSFSICWMCGYCRGETRVAVAR